jgi:hypothetical protein
MLKCRQFVDDGPNLEDIIFLDCKTGGIGEIGREDCLMQKIISAKGADADGNDIFGEAVSVEEAREKLIKIVNENPRLSIGFGINKNQYEEEEISISEMAKVQSMWGVKLKKTPKNVQGEEFMFVCQKTGQFGEISRKKCIEKGLITEIKDAQKQFIIGEAEVDFEERSNLVEKIRTLLKLGVHE